VWWGHRGEEPVAITVEDLSGVGADNFASFRFDAFVRMIDVADPDRDRVTPTTTVAASARRRMLCPSVRRDGPDHVGRVSSPIERFCRGAESSVSQGSTRSGAVRRYGG